MPREPLDPRYLTPEVHRRPGAHDALPSASPTVRGFMTPAQVAALEAAVGAVDLSGLVTDEGLAAVLAGYLRRGEGGGGTIGATGSFPLMTDLLFYGTVLYSKTLTVMVANGLVTAIGPAGEWTLVPTSTVKGAHTVLQGLGSAGLITQGYGV